MTTTIASTVRLCQCGEYTYSPTCGPCRPPACPRCMAAAGSAECCTPERLARLTRTKPCGCFAGTDCGHGRGWFHPSRVEAPTGIVLVEKVERTDQ